MKKRTKAIKPEQIGKLYTKPKTTSSRVKKGALAEKVRAWQCDD